MLITPIRHALSSIKEELTKLYSSSPDSDINNKIVYDVTPLIDMTKQVIDIIDNFGIEQFDIQKVNKTKSLESEYINDLQDTLHRIIMSISKIIDELTTDTNSMLQLYTDKINQIEPIMEDLRKDIDDIESQTLEKVANKSIFDHEIKNVIFDKNIQNSNLSYFNGTLLLPIVSSVSLIPDDHSFVINGSTEARNRLDQKIIATSDVTDADLLKGTYFGNIIGKIDGSDAFKSQDEFNIDSIHNENVNDNLEINYYNNISNDEVDVTVNNLFNSNTIFNFLTITSNVDPVVSLTDEADRITNIQLVNNTWAAKMTTNKIGARFVQTRATNLKYQGIDIYRGDNLYKRHNYFNSLNFKYPDLLKELNNKIVTSEIEVFSYNRVVENDRHGFYKYGINVNNIDIRRNTYSAKGEYVSSLITTEEEIAAVELDADFYIPDEQLEYIQYFISFDNVEWFPIVSRFEGVTEFNVNKKKRIVLNNNNDNDEYLFIGHQEQNKGLYLKVKMVSQDSLISPAIYNLRLRIKVDTDE
jgi:hypothetical protein